MDPTVTTVTTVTLCTKGLHSCCCVYWEKLLGQEVNTGHLPVKHQSVGVCGCPCITHTPQHHGCMSTSSSGCLCGIRPCWCFTDFVLATAPCRAPLRRSFALWQLSSR